MMMHIVRVMRSLIEERIIKPIVPLETELFTRASLIVVIDLYDTARVTLKPAHNKVGQFLIQSFFHFSSNLCLTERELFNPITSTNEGISIRQSDVQF
jgi:hypothetical protein